MMRVASFFGGIRARAVVGAILLAFPVSHAMAQSADMPGGQPYQGNAPVENDHELSLSDATRCDVALATLSNARQIGGRGYPTLLGIFADTVAMDAVQAADGSALPAARSFLVSATIQVCRANPGLVLSDAAHVARVQMDKLVTAALTSGGGQ